MVREPSVSLSTIVFSIEKTIVDSDWEGTHHDAVTVQMCVIDLHEPTSQVFRIRLVMYDIHWLRNQKGIVTRA